MGMKQKQVENVTTNTWPHYVNRHVKMAKIVYALRKCSKLLEIVALGVEKRIVLGIEIYVYEIYILLIP